MEKLSLYIIYVILLIPIEWNGSITYYIADTIQKREVTTETIYDYSKLIQTIKDSEGLTLNIYKCIAGHNTIGYGHVITKDDKFDKLDSLQADSLLISDILKAKKEIYNISPVRIMERWDNNKINAIIGLVFNIGIGSYSKSELRQCINNKANIRLIIIEWLEFSCYTN